MKKLIVLLVMLCHLAPVLQAYDGMQQNRLSREEFRAKQQAYITEKAGLTGDEAAKFFPVYFELQDQKKKLNDEAWKLLRKGKQENISEAVYGDILKGVYKARIEAEKLDQTYLEKFKRILSYKKIYKVLQAEMHFHRELLRSMRQRGKNGK